jgi:hypothetical protein
LNKKPPQEEARQPEEHFASSCGGFLFNSSSKMIEIPLLAAFLLWSFLIQFLFKIDEKSSRGVVTPTVLLPYSKMMINLEGFRSFASTKLQNL